MTMVDNGWHWLLFRPDGRLHLTAKAYDGFNPHFISTDGNLGNDWVLVEKIVGWGGVRCL